MGRFSPVSRWLTVLIVSVSLRWLSTCSTTFQYNSLAWHKWLMIVKEVVVIWGRICIGMSTEEIGFLFHDSGYRESFLQVPKAHVSLEHYLSNTCGWLECLIFPSFFTSEVTWHNTGNLMLKRWILSSQQLPILFLNQKWMNGFCSYIMAFKCNQRNSHLCCSYSKLRQQLFLTLGQE